MDWRRNLKISCFNQAVGTIRFTSWRRVCVWAVGLIRVTIKHSRIPQQRLQQHPLWLNVQWQIKRQLIAVSFNKQRREYTQTLSQWAKRQDAGEGGSSSGPIGNEDRSCSLVPETMHSTSPFLPVFSCLPTRSLTCLDVFLRSPESISSRGARALTWLNRSCLAAGCH